MYKTDSRNISVRKRILANSANYFISFITMAFLTHVWSNIRPILFERREWGIHRDHKRKRYCNFWLPIIANWVSLCFEERKSLYLFSATWKLDWLSAFCSDCSFSELAFIMEFQCRISIRNISFRKRVISSMTRRIKSLTIQCSIFGMV